MFKMAKKSRVQTPAWILEGYDSREEYEKAKGKISNKKSGKTFKIRRCPDCNSDEVRVVVGEESKGLWECSKCNWRGKNIKEEELNEEEFLRYLDKKEGN